MKNKLDISWKDFLAGVAGYFVSVLLVGCVFVGVGMLVAKTGDETIFARYEFVIACATFLGFFVGGIVLGAIRPNTAARNAITLFLVLLIMGAWRMGSEIASAVDVILVVLQVSGLILGAWLVQRRYIQKKKLV